MNVLPISPLISCCDAEAAHAFLALAAATGYLIKPSPDA